MLENQCQIVYKKLNLVQKIRQHRFWVKQSKFRSWNLTNYVIVICVSGLHFLYKHTYQILGFWKF